MFISSSQVLRTKKNSRYSYEIEPLSLRFRAQMLYYLNHGDSTVSQAAIKSIFDTRPAFCYDQQCRKGYVPRNISKMS